MSNKTQLQTNNTKLDDILTRINDATDTVDSLPDAGGGSGTSVETCTLTIMLDEQYGFYIDSMFFHDGDTFQMLNLVKSETTFSVVKNSCLSLHVSGGPAPAIHTSDNIVLCGVDGGMYLFAVYDYGLISITAGGTDPA